MHKHFIFFIAVIFFSNTSLSQTITPLGHGLRVNGDVFCIEFDSLSGRTFIGGYFSQVEDMPASNIAWHDAAGWHPFGNGTTGYVAALKFANGKLYAAGHFSEIDHTTLNNIGSWDGSSWQQLGPGISGSLVRNLEWYDSSLYVSGYFSGSGNVSSYNIISWDGTSWHSVGQGANNPYVYMSLLDDTLYAYGDFTTFNGFITSAVKFDGAAWTPVQTDTLYYVRSMAKNRDTLFAVLSSRLNSGAAKIVYFDTAGWADYIIYSGTSYHPFLYSYHDTLFFAANRTSIDSVQVRSIADVYHQTLSAFSTPGSNSDYDIRSVKIFRDEVFITGFFNNLNAGFSSGVTKYDGHSWSSPFHVSIGYRDAWYNCWGRFMTFDSLSNQLIVSGRFNFAGDLYSPNVAAWDGNTWHAMGDGLSGDDDAVTRDLIFFKDTLYVCGTFVHSGSAAVRGIAKWNGASWLPVGGFCNGSVRSMTVFQDTLYVIGEFDTIGNVAAKYIAKYDGASWHPVPEVDAYSGADLAGITAASGKLYLVGTDFKIGNTSNLYFGIFDGTSWTFPGFYFQDFYTLRTLNDSVYAGTRNSPVIYKFNGTSWYSVGYIGSQYGPGYPSLIQNHFVVGDWNYGTSIKINNSWRELISEHILDCLDRDSTSSYVTGFIPESYLGGNRINNIGLLNIQPPVASFTYNTDSICDHEYIFYTAALTDLTQQYSWTFPGGSPSAFTVQNPIVRYINPGDFDVYFKVTNAFGSDSTALMNAIHVQNCSATQIYETEKSHIEIYPNPFSDSFTVKNDSGKILSLTMTDISGRTIFRKTSDQAAGNSGEIITPGIFTPGIYLLTVNTSSGTTAFKIIRL